MSYIALYRKWRPQVFEDIVEQQHVVKTLKYSVCKGRISHAYLFCGTRGTGKTTIAQILARAINCLNSVDGNPCNECEICRGILAGSILDVLEIDAASNNSVDNVREIRSEVVYSPSQAKYKVYIIDEVHMLSTGAFNALLKTLEEPPAHVIFILATTEPHKLPATILSRCMRFDFRKITTGSIAARLKKIAGESSISIEEEALSLIAVLSDGALRDAISILDQCISTGNTAITYNDVLSITGMANDTFITGFTDTLDTKDVDRILQLVDTLVMDGKDIAQFVSDLINYYRNLLVCKISGAAGDIIEASSETVNKMKAQCAGLKREDIIYTIKELSLLESNLKWATHPRILLEVALIKLCENIPGIGNNDVLERLTLLEKKADQAFQGYINHEPEAGAKKNNHVPGAEISSNNRVPVAEIKSDSRVHGAAGADDPARPLQVKNSNHTPGTSVRSQDHASETEVEKNVHEPAANTASGPKETAPAVADEKRELPYWEEILKELKSGGKNILYVKLADTKAYELGKNSIAIVFSTKNSIYKMLVSKPENSEVIMETLRKKSGQDINIKFFTEDEFENSNKNITGKQEDDFMEKAVGLAKEINVPYNIVDK